jgi:hypothetical protein
VIDHDKLSTQNEPTPQREAWVEPVVRQLDVSETNALPRRGADIGGNPAVDCQFS